VGKDDSGGDILPELYLKIVESIPFKLELIITKLKIEGQDSKVAYKEYVE
jgi:hypothetical protein